MVHQLGAGVPLLLGQQGQLLLREVERWAVIWTGINIIIIIINHHHYYYHLVPPNRKILSPTLTSACLLRGLGPRPGGVTRLQVQVSVSRHQRSFLCSFVLPLNPGKFITSMRVCNQSIQLFVTTNLQKSAFSRSPGREPNETCVLRGRGHGCRGWTRWR